MRVTDNRYAAEMSRFNLAVRMIGHEARTGTIRACTGFSEDRIRKIYATYFKAGSGPTVRRRRGKSPKQITPYVNSAANQSEATVLACLFIHCGVMEIDSGTGFAADARLNPVRLGNHICDAYEAYRCIHPNPCLCFEKSWGLYSAMARDQELIFAFCADCGGPYVQDRYSLDYRHCPFCDIKENSS
ncbi:MAG: FlhC family transcriptional regulator [Gammaproteobacteria bacterium]|jgi:hypothetical protein